MGAAARFLDFSATDIDAQLRSLADAPRLALDTESDPFHRYFEKVCLLQISHDTEDFFFDPLAHGMPDALRAILTDPARTIVMHGADYDVRTLKRSFGLALHRLVDTQLAAQFLGRTNTGLKALLEEELSVVIDKGEQRSDWGHRPLTDKQLVYARQDTQHLLALADALLEKLDALGRVSWLEEECALMLEREPTEKRFDPEGWRKLKGIKEMNKRGRQTLRALFVWREGLAQAQDRPPFRIVRNEGLVRIAADVDRDGPPTVARLERMKFVPKWIDRRRLVAAIAEGLAGPVPDKRPPRKAGKPGVPHTPESKARLEALKLGRAEWAKALGMDPGFLVSGSVLESIAKAAPADLTQLAKIPGMTAWRVAAVGAETLAALAVGPEGERC